MKFVDRTQVLRPASLDSSANSPAKKEFILALQHYASGAKVSYDFKVYKSNDVRAALDTLFKEHCAYCESYFGATQPEDVEHFRPKGRVTGEPEHIGYWWLAANWDNLLPSCIDCNRRRSHQVLIYDENTGLINIVKDSVVGKGNSFPVYSNRAFNIGDEVYEVPLLICPTSEDPSRFLMFKVIDDFVLATLTPSNDNFVKIKGEATIKCFGLNRQGLVEKRMKLANIIQCGFLVVEKAFNSAIYQKNPEFRNELIQLALGQLEEFEDGIKKQSEYSVFASYFLQYCKEKLIEKYQTLLSEVI